MKTSKLIVCLALIAPVSFAWAQKVDPNKLPMEVKVLPVPTAESWRVIEPAQK